MLNRRPLLSSRLGGAASVVRAGQVLTGALAIYLVTANAAWAQGQRPDWARDIGLLTEAIDSRHPSPYGVTPRDSILGAADRLADASDSLTYHQIVMGIQRLLAMVGDGHTGLAADPALDDSTRAARGLGPGEGFATTYPVRFRVFWDGLHVVEERSTQPRALGRKVTHINGRPTVDVVSRLLPFVPADNVFFAVQSLPMLLARPAALHAVGLADGVGSDLHLTVVGPNGATSEQAFSPLPMESTTSWSKVEPAMRPGSTVALTRSVAGPYGFVDLEEHRAVYVRYRQVRDAAGESVEAFAERLFDHLEAGNAERLIIDVRGNDGGNAYLNQPIIHGLIKNSALNRPGRLFVLTNSRTFSAAVQFAADVERHTHAVFVGEPPGSPNNHFGDARGIRLPESGLRVRISTLYWQSGDPRDERPAIFPDVPIAPTFAEYAAGRDAALEAALAYRDDTRAQDPSSPNLNWRRPSQEAGWPHPIRW